MPGSMVELGCVYAPISQILLHGHLLEDVTSLGDLRQTVLDDLVRRNALEVMALKE